MAPAAPYSRNLDDRIIRGFREYREAFPEHRRVSITDEEADALLRAAAERDQLLFERAVGAQ